MAACERGLTRKEASACDFVEPINRGNKTVSQQDQEDLLAFERSIDNAKAAL